MNISLLIVTYSLIFLVGFSLLLFSYLIIRRVVVQHHENEFKQKYEKIEKDILDIVVSPEEGQAEKISSRYKYQSYD